jgi:predicted nucleic acid-binding protein
MARRPIFDTSVFSDYASEIEKLLLSSLFPTLVFYELVATSIDESTLQKYERWRVLSSKNKLLLNPTSNDWWETSKAIRRLYLMGTEQPTKIKTLRNDALISRLAVFHDGVVVTHDIDDFQIIQKVMPSLKIMSAQDFFET